MVAEISKIRPSGFYKHKETGIVVEINELPGLGNPIADAFVQVGYDYVGTDDPRVSSEDKSNKKEGK